MKKRNWYLTFGSVLTACMLVFIALGFFWTPYDPGALSARDKLAEQLGREPDVTELAAELHLPREDVVFAL